MEILLTCVLAIFFLGVANAGLNPLSVGRDNAQAGSEHGFRYAVNDYNGNEHSHQQQKVGDTTTGEYKVLLPDGRLQTVTYIADAGGYRAKVSYTPASPGEATTAGSGAPGVPVVPGASLGPIAPPVVQANRGALPIHPQAFFNSGIPYNNGNFNRNVPTAFGPSSGSIYPGHPLYQPELAYQGVSHYGPQLAYQAGYPPFAYNNQNNPGFGSQAFNNPFYRSQGFGKK